MARKVPLTFATMIRDCWNRRCTSRLAWRRLALVCREMLEEDEKECPALSPVADVDRAVADRKLKTGPLMTQSGRATPVQIAR